jgi:hypothetical protein
MQRRDFLIATLVLTLVAGSSGDQATYLSGSGSGEAETRTPVSGVGDESAHKDAKAAKVATVLSHAKIGKTIVLTINVKKVSGIQAGKGNKSNRKGKAVKTKGKSVHLSEPKVGSNKQSATVLESRDVASLYGVLAGVLAVVVGVAVMLFRNTHDQTEQESKTVFKLISRLSADRLAIIEPNSYAYGSDLYV